MTAKLVMHNQVSLDGAITGFEVNLELHYRLVAGYAPGLMLVGSVTAQTGIETFAGPVPREEDADRRRPENPDDTTPQLLLGHRSLQTTSRYLRVATTTVCSTTSPLDLLPRPAAERTQPVD